MYKVGICGFLGDKNQVFDGQSVKTNILTEELRSIYGSDRVKVVNTYRWKKNPFKLLINCLLLVKKCENIVILPAQNGVRVFIPLFLLLNKFFHRKLHYVVIGGWLQELLRDDDRLKSKICKFNGVYVETKLMLTSLIKLGIKNAKIFPNFKPLDFIGENELIYQNCEPYKLCTFSRVIKEKGIEDAINAVKNVNNYFGRVVYMLDIYGSIGKKYEYRFKELTKEFPKYITYKGIINFNQSVKVLKNYFALLFPTQFKTEGIPGTIIDAYASGIPVIASNWNSASEIIIHNETGIIYDFMENSKLEEILIQVALNPTMINKMKKNCLKMARRFSPETVIKDLVKNM